LASLPFIGIGLGLLLGIVLNTILNKKYVAKAEAADGHPLPPEARLPLCCAGGIAFFVGLLMLAFTADKEIHWIAPVIAGVPFGFGSFEPLSLVVVLASRTRRADAPRSSRQAWLRSFSA
jgi:hypothetical protein